VYLHGLQISQRQRQNRRCRCAKVSGPRGKHCEKLQGQEGPTIVRATQTEEGASGERGD